MKMINITLFIQVFHFYITYVVLAKFIFKPVIESIKKQVFEQDNLNKELEAKKLILLQKENHKHQDLLNFQKTVRDKYYMPPKEIIKYEHDIGYKRNPEEINCLTKKIKSLIIKEVPRVR